MPSSYTQNGGIIKPANGELPNTWGDAANVDFDIIDRLTNGVGSIELSGTTYTLTTGSGTVNEGQYKVLAFTGSLGAACTVTISPNTAQKYYFVRNSTNQSVIISQGSGSTVTIPATQSRIVYADGAGGTAAVFDFSSVAGLVSPVITTPTITGGSISGITDLAVADGGTGSSTPAGAQTNLGFTGALTTIIGANLTASRALASDGSGKVIVSAVTATELTFLSGVTSAIQTQLDARQPLDADLTAVAGLATAGIVTRTGAGTATTRSVAGGTGVTVTNGDGVAGNPTVAFNGSISTVAVTATADNDGSFATGTYTPTPVGGNFKTITNAGAFSIAAPSVAGDYTLVIQITNATGAGAITLTGFSKTTGDAFTTVVGNDFFVFITKLNGLTSAVVQALQ